VTGGGGRRPAAEGPKPGDDDGRKRGQNRGPVRQSRGTNKRGKRLWGAGPTRPVWTGVANDRQGSPFSGERNRGRGCRGGREAEDRV